MVAIGSPGGIPERMQTVEAAGLAIGASQPTRIMGVINLSEESPYDPSVFTDPDAAAAYVDEELIAEGADIVDVGLESANKRYDVLSAAAERDRLERAFEMLDASVGDAVFSIETRYSEVAEAALDGGFDMVNDICGFADPDLASLCAERSAPVVKMAGPGSLTSPGAVHSVDEIYDALASEPLPETTIVDPAFGGWSEDKSLEIDRETLRRLREFQAIGQPILVSINRKNFLRELADRSTAEALPVSLAATSLAVERGADVIRTHDVAATRDAALIGDAFAPNRLSSDEYGVYELDIQRPIELARHLDRLDAGRATAMDMSAYAFELRDLDPVDRDFLAFLVPAHDGRCVRAGDGQTCLLIAGPRTIWRLREAVREESDRLLDRFDIMCNHIDAQAAW